MAKKVEPKPVAKKKSLADSVEPEKPKPGCKVCGGKLETSARSGDEGVAKSRCVNEQCEKYGISNA